MSNDRPTSVQQTSGSAPPSPPSDGSDEFMEQFYGIDRETERLTAGWDQFQGQRQQLPVEQGVQRVGLQRDEPAQRVRLTRPWHPYSGLRLDDINLYINQNSEARVRIQDETSVTASPILDNGEPFRLIEEQDISETALPESRALADNENRPSPTDGSESDSVVELLPGTHATVREGEVDGVPTQIWELISRDESWFNGLRSNNPGSIVTTATASTAPLQSIHNSSSATGVFRSRRTTARLSRDRVVHFIEPRNERAESPDTIEIIETGYIPPPNMLRRREAIIRLSARQNVEGSNGTSLDSPSTESAAESASSLKEEQYNFSQERRQQLMWELMNDMNLYDVKKEREFGRQHGYQLCSRDETPETTVVAENPTVRAMRDVRAAFATADRERLIQSSPRHRSVLLRPNRVRFSDGVEEDGDASPTTESVRRRGVSTIGNLVRRRTEFPLTIDTPDFTEEFLSYLLSEWRWSTEETGLVFQTTVLRAGGARWRYSLRETTGQNSSPTNEEFENFQRSTIRLRDNQLLLALLYAAVNDGLDVREAHEFVKEWSEYTQNWRDPFLQVPSMIGIQPLQFWVALRRGWGEWTPSDECLSNVRRRLMLRSLLNHRLENRAVLEMSAADANHVVHFEIEEVGLPDSEMNRLCHLLQEGTDAQRVLVILQNWCLAADFVEASRLPSERDVSIERLRLDRLERMIREENVLNARRVTLPSSIVRNIRLYDSSR